MLNDGKGGYALEVIDFKAGYARSLHVCRHPGHDSYYADQNFDGVDAGKQVKMLGVELTKDADGKVTTELSSTVSLVWTSFPTWKPPQGTDRGVRRPEDTDIQRGRNSGARRRRIECQSTSTK